MFDEGKEFKKLVEVEKKMDQIIRRKQIQNCSPLIGPQIIIPKRIRIFISHLYHRLDSETQIPKWELRIEGRLIDDCSYANPILPPSHLSTLEKLVANKTNKRFNDFFSNVVVELPANLYGTTQNIIEWKRDPNAPTDGCVIARNGDSDIQLKIKFWRYNNPQKFKIHPYLAKLLGFAYGTRSNIMEALFSYIRTEKLQDFKENGWINCDSRFHLLFGVTRLRMSEIPLRIQKYLFLSDPIIIEHTIRVADRIKPMIACYELDVEINNTTELQNPEVFYSLENAIQNCDLVIGHTISRIKHTKGFFDAATQFSNDPVNALEGFIKGQSSDLQIMKENSYVPEPARRVEPYLQENMKEAVNRYLYHKVAQKRAELEAGLCIKRY
uniref:DM2 domain-containing protein n=1 Tax=Panagrolaimus sp. PS1159 TaxID=55785 RepID=A0AC35FER9_9BILA